MKIGLFIVAFVMTGSILGQTNTTLSYQNYILNILENNPLATVANSRNAFARMNYKAAVGNYDPIVSGSSNEKLYNGKNYFSVYNFEIKQPLFTSQYLKLGYDYGVGTFVNPEYYTPNVGLPYLGLELSLLQGLIIDKRRAALLKAKEYVSYYDAERRIQLNELLHESSKYYFDWIFALKLSSLHRYFLSIAGQRLEALKALGVAGERPAIDTVEAAMFYQTRQLDLQQVQLENQNIQNYLSNFYWLQANGVALAPNFIPTDSLETHYQRARNYYMQHLPVAALANPSIQKYIATQKILQVETKVSRENIKPILNLNYRLLSSNADSYTPAFSANNYKWGVFFSFPLLFRNSINELRMAKLAVENNKLELQNKTNEINLKLIAITNSITVLLSQLALAERSALYSKQLVTAEQLKFEIGESSLFLVNTRESKWLETELKLAEYKSKFIKAVLQQIYLEGQLKYEL